MSLKRKYRKIVEEEEEDGYIDIYIFFLPPQFFKGLYLLGH